MTTATIPTRDEVEALKQNWLNDPCWDIEETEGFEFYREELAIYRLGIENENQERYDRELNADAARWGVSVSGALMIRSLRGEIARLESQLARL